MEGWSGDNFTDDTGTSELQSTGTIPKTTTPRTVYSAAEALEHADERNPPNAKTQAAIAFQLSRIADVLEILAKGTQP